MPIKRYEISDYQWNQIKHLYPTAKTGRPPKDNRMVFNAIENLSIDSTLVKALQHSAGAKKGRQDTKPASRTRNQPADWEKPWREHNQNPYRLNQIH